MAAARRPTPKAPRPLGDPLRRAPQSTPQRRRQRRGSPRAAGQGGGGRAARAAAPPRRLRGLVAGPRLRPHERLPARLGPSRCPVSGRVPPAAHSPPPSARPQDRVGQAPRRARAPLGAPAPHTQPNGFRGACPGGGGCGGGGDGTRTPRSATPFPKGAPALSPPSHAALRRSNAATPAPLLRVPDRSRSTSAAEPALGAAAAAGALTVGVVSRQ